VVALYHSLIVNAQQAITENEQGITHVWRVPQVATKMSQEMGIPALHQQIAKPVLLTKIRLLVMQGVNVMLAFIPTR